MTELQFWTRDCRVGSRNNSLCLESGGTLVFLCTVCPINMHMFVINDCHILVRPTGDCTSMWCTWWHHVMEALSALLVLWEGNNRRPVDSPHNGPVLWTYDFFVSLNTLLDKLPSCWWFDVHYGNIWYHYWYYKLYGVDMTRLTVTRLFTTNDGNIDQGWLYFGGTKITTHHAPTGKLFSDLHF